LVQCAVRAMVVKVHHILSQHCHETAAVDDQYPVEQLAAYGADPSFGDRVRPGCSHGCAQDADAPAGEHSIEHTGELAVAIPDQERELSRAIAEVHQEVLRLLGDPGAVRVRRDAQEVHAAGGVLHDEQHVKLVEQQCNDAEEVGGENAVGLGGQELSPAGAVAARCWIHVGSLQDQPHRAGRSE
jgi:hypothetical protein